MMSSGLTERITLLFPVTERTSYGDETTRWDGQREIWAELSERKGTRRLDNSELFETTSITFNIRIEHKVGEDWRIRYGGYLYQITSVIPNRRRGLQRITCDRVNE